MAFHQHLVATYSLLTTLCLPSPDGKPWFGFHEPFPFSNRLAMGLGWKAEVEAEANTKLHSSHPTALSWK